MRAFVCDICKNQFVGNYKEVSENNTSGICLSIKHWDVCESCWRAFISCRPIQLVDFPNKEGNDGEGNEPKV